jgi:hypothetical protein
MTPRNVRRLTVASICLAVFWFICQKSPFTAPGSILSPVAIPIHQTFTVPVDHEYQLTLPPPGVKIPGWLRGHWTVQGASAGIKNATDDTLASFTLTGANNQILERQTRPISGNFNIRCNGGQVTMTFNNTGLLRLSARVVTLDGSYQPD